jgi:adenosylcobinamide kinase/adenosylcobinamide-phosphate guanylyltransferase
MASTLIIGGMKSGKSMLAEQQAIHSNLPVTYVATASAHDNEMQQRIQRHQQCRPVHWQTVEESIHLASLIKNHDRKNQCIVIDCLTLWLTNLLMLENDALLNKEIEEFVQLISSVKGQLIMVSNESNMGIIPLGELTRRYCDEVGILHQRLAQQCDNVIFTIAGLPHVLKGQHHDSV